MSTNKIGDDKNDGFALGKKNYRLFFIGLGVLVLGYVLMIGGGSDDPNVFNYDTLFSPVRMTVSPILILIGFATIAVSIVKKYEA
jgi:uncharacterized membrane protein